MARLPELCAFPQLHRAGKVDSEGREAQIEPARFFYGERWSRREINGTREGGRTDEQSTDTLAKICETLVQPIAGSGPAPVEERGLGGGGGGGERAE